MPGNSHIDNECIFINQDLEVDIDFAFTKSTLYFAPGVKVSVKSGVNLLVQESILDACEVEAISQMWHGIEVQPEGEFRIGLSEVNNAFKAISSYGGTVKAFSVDFDRNYIGMDLVPDLNRKVSNVFLNLNFACSKPLLPHYNLVNDPGGNLILTLEKSYYAIRATDFNNFYLGKITDNGSCSVSDHHIGFQFSSCIGQIVSNVSFERVNNFNNVPVANPGFEPSWCIISSNCLATPHFEMITTTKSDNGILNLLSGGRVTDSEIFVEGCGIDFRGPVNDCIVTNSSISSTNDAVFINDVSGGYIEGNSIIGGENGLRIDLSDHMNVINNSQLIGIQGAGLAFNSTQFTSIEGNPQIEGGSFGIYLADAQNAVFKENTILNSDFGLYGVGAENISYCCNDFIQNTTGISFVNSCMHTNLVGTQFVDNLGYGLLLYEQAEIGPQLLSGNSWSLETAATDAAYLGGIQGAQADRFRVSFPNIPASGMNIYPPNLANTWFEFVNEDDLECGSISSGACSSNSDGSLSAWGGIAQPNIADVRIANENFNIVDDFHKGSSFMKKQFLFNASAENANFLNNEDIAAFFSTNSNTILGESAKLLSSIGGLKLEEPSEYSAIKKSVDAYQEESITLLASINGDITLVENQELLKEKAELDEGILVEISRLKEMYQEIKSEYEINRIYLLEENALLEETEVVIQNEKIMNNFILSDYLSRNLVVLEEEKNIINNIASQCVSEGGRAVLQARAIASRWGFDATSCLNVVQERDASEKVLIDKKRLQIFPSPASTLLMYNYLGTEEVVSIEIFDMFGVKQMKEVGGHEVNISNLMNGVYHAVLYLNNGKVVSRSFNIQH